MKRRMLFAACSALIAAFAGAQDTAPATPAAGARWVDLRTAPVVQGGDAQAGADKAQRCAACHGPGGHSAVPAFPSLAGLPPTYVYLQLREYRQGLRANAVMSAQAQDLSEQDMLDLAAYFASQSPQQAGAAVAADLLQRGRQVYLQGDPAQGVPACQGCHGADGRGPRPAVSGATPWHTFPALAGQQANYVVAQLQAYKDGTRAASSNAMVMQAVVRNMDQQTMQALAAFVSTRLPPP